MVDWEEVKEEVVVVEGAAEGGWEAARGVEMGVVVEGLQKGESLLWQLESTADKMEGRSACK